MNTDHFTPQFTMGIHKYYIDSISRTDGAIIGRNEYSIDNNRITQRTTEN
jgi:hypothetical protein